MENSLWRYYEAAYAMYDRLRKRFPHLILENCAGGGGRTDLGMLSRFHYTWITDWQIAPRSLRILNGMTIALPPERVDRNAGVGQNAHTRGSLDLQMRGTMLSHMTLTGIYPSPDERNPEHVDRVKHHVQIYKTFIRDLLPECLVYHHTPVLPGREPRGWCVLEYLSQDRTQGVVGIFRLADGSEPEYRLRLRGVEGGRRYRVRFDNSGSEAELDGERLKSSGLAIGLPSPMTSELLLLRPA
jgi:alpha-galactosidase